MEWLFNIRSGYKDTERCVVRKTACVFLLEQIDSSIHICIYTQDMVQNRDKGTEKGDCLSLWIDGVKYDHVG